MKLLPRKLNPKNMTFVALEDWSDNPIDFLRLIGISLNLMQVLKLEIYLANLWLSLKKKKKCFKIKLAFFQSFFVPQ